MRNARNAVTGRKTPKPRPKNYQYLELLQKCVPKEVITNFVLTNGHQQDYINLSWSGFAKPATFQGAVYAGQELVVRYHLKDHLISCHVGYANLNKELFDSYLASVMLEHGPASDPLLPRRIRKKVRKYLSIFLPLPQTESKSPGDA